MESTKGRLTAGQLAAYERDGLVLVENYLSAQDLTDLRSTIATHVDVLADALYAEGKIQDLCQDSPFEQRWWHIQRQTNERYVTGKDGATSWHPEVYNDGLFNLLTGDKVLNTMESIMGPELAYFGHYWIRPKLPGDEQTAIPWHQDIHFMEGTENAPSVVLWAALVDIDGANGCLEFVPGSHKWGCIPPDEVDGQSPYPVEHPPTRPKVQEMVMKAGDAVFFHNLTFHRSTCNETDGIRWNFDTRYTNIDRVEDYYWKARDHAQLVVRSDENPQRVATLETWDRYYEAYGQKTRDLCHWENDNT